MRWRRSPRSFARNPTMSGRLPIRPRNGCARYWARRPGRPRERREVVTNDDYRTVAEVLRERLNSIGQIVEEHITDEDLEARLRRLKDSAGDHRLGVSVDLRGRRALLDSLLELTR